MSTTGTPAQVGGRLMSTTAHDSHRAQRLATSTTTHTPRDHRAPRLAPNASLTPAPIGGTR